MEQLATARPLARPDAVVPAFETPAARCYHLPPGGAAPAGTEVVMPLPDATRLAYAPRGNEGVVAVELPVDPLLRGNAFSPLHQSAITQVALLSVAAARRVDVGPESERVFVILRGLGLVFLDNGDTFRIEPGTWAFIPAGEAARLWAQGPEDLLAIALQPAGQRAERRTLAGELAKLKERRAPGAP